MLLICKLHIHNTGCVQPCAPQIFRCLNLDPPGVRGCVFHLAPTLVDCMQPGVYTVQETSASQLDYPISTRQNFFHITIKNCKRRLTSKNDPNYFHFDLSRKIYFCPKKLCTREASKCFVQEITQLQMSEFMEAIFNFLPQRLFNILPRIFTKFTLTCLS